MSIGVSGGPVFVSAIHLRHRRFISTAVQQQRAPKVASGRPAGTDAAWDRQVTSADVTWRSSWGYAAVGTVKKQ